MLPWLIVPAVGGAAYLVLWALRGKAQAEYEHWGSTYLQVQGRLRRHREVIAEHVEFAQQCCDFHSLCELHFASVKLANEAYRLLRDAQVAESETRQAIDTLKAKMEEIYSQTKAPGLSRLDREKLHSELAELKQVKESLFETAGTISKQVGHFRTEVRRLNEKTRGLKRTIRDRCGSRGAEWCKRLEARTRERGLCRVA